MDFWRGIRAEEGWQGYAVNQLEIQAGSDLLTDLILNAVSPVIPVWDTVRGFGPAAIATPGAVRSAGVAMANRITVGVVRTAGAGVLRLDILGAMHEGVAFGSMFTVESVAGVGAGTNCIMREVCFPYVSFNLVETGAAATATVNVWAMVKSLGSGGQL